MNKTLVAIFLLISASSSHGEILKVGKIYTANVDMCIYETIGAVQFANQELRSLTKSIGISKKIINILKTEASSELNVFETKNKGLLKEITEANSFLLTAVNKALININKSENSEEKNNKIKILNILKSDLKEKVDTISSNDCKMIGYGTKFEVLSIPNNDYYIIKIVDYYGYYVFENGKETSKNSDVVTHALYYLNEKHGSTGVKVTDFVYNSFNGVTSGPLIIPFKYRTNDKSISGEVTIGYYAGYTFSISKDIGITPIISAGLSQIPVAETTGTNNELITKNRTGFTWAIGFLLSNWDGVNIGLVYGQDRIGDSSWEHEGKPWASFSIGWNL